MLEYFIKQNICGNGVDEVHPEFPIAAQGWKISKDCLRGGNGGGEAIDASGKIDIELNLRREQDPLHLTSLNGILQKSAIVCCVFVLSLLSGFRSGKSWRHVWNCRRWAVVSKRLGKSYRV